MGEWAEISKPHPKRCPHLTITSHNRPGFPIFQRATLKNTGRLRYKATQIINNNTYCTAPFWTNQSTIINCFPCNLVLEISTSVRNTHSETGCMCMCNSQSHDQHMQVSYLTKLGLESLQLLIEALMIIAGAIFYIPIATRKEHPGCSPDQIQLYMHKCIAM